ncbi:TPA: hypothetical protein ROY01_006136 [Bacillus toyonensis]|nr:hypothetical protein [Bacillus toyonensis]
MTCKENNSAEYEKSGITDPKIVKVTENGKTKTATWDQIFISGEDSGNVHFTLKNVKLVLRDEEFKGDPNYATVSFELRHDGYQADSRIANRLKPPILNFYFLGEDDGVLWSFGRLRLGKGDSWYEPYAICLDTEVSRDYELGVKRRIFSDTVSAKPGVKDYGYVYTCPKDIE